MPDDIENSILADAGFENEVEDNTDQQEELLDTENTEGDLETEVSKTDDKDEKEPSAGADGDKQPDAQPSGDNTRDGSQRKQDEERIPSKRYVDYDYDAKGNVVNPKTGKVLYELGSPAHKIFRELRNTQFKESQASKNLNKAIELGKQFEREANDFRAAHQDAQKFGLSSAEVSEGVKLKAALKAKPVETLRYLLTEAQANGTDLKDIFENVSTIQVDAITKMIDKRLAPLTERQQTQRQTNEAQTAAAQEVESFYEQFPEARLHEDHLAELVSKAAEQGSYPTLPEVYAHFARYCNRNGFDITKSLAPQVAARRQQPNVRREQPMPRGNGNGRGVIPREKNAPFKERSSKNIVKEAMLEGGFRFDDED